MMCIHIKMRCYYITNICLFLFWWIIKTTYKSSVTYQITSFLLKITGHSIRNIIPPMSFSILKLFVVCSFFSFCDCSFVEIQKLFIQCNLWAKDFIEIFSLCRYFISITKCFITNIIVLLSKSKFLFYSSKPYNCWSETLW